MQPARVVGWAIGAGALFCSFFLPFWNLTSGSGGGLDTLYGSVRFVFAHFPAMSQWGVAEVTLLAVLMVACAMLVWASGVLGAFPRVSGAFGIVGMLGLTAGPIVLFPTFDFTTSDFGTGFYALWALSIANLIVGSAMRGSKPSPAAAAPQVPTQAPAPPPQTPPPPPPAAPAQASGFDM